MSAKDTLSVRKKKAKLVDRDEFEPSVKTRRESGKLERIKSLDEDSTRAREVI